MTEYNVKNEFYAKVIADSLAPSGKRLITMEVNAPRFILAEINTHRMLSRNSASSRATPVKKRIEMIKASPVEFVEWGLNKSGMQATEFLSPEDERKAKELWHSAKDFCLDIAAKLDELKCHKQIANRTCETFAFNKQVISGTEWINHNFQRTHKDAQPEYQYLSRLIAKAQKESTPTLLLPGLWHLPYIQFEEMPKHLDDETLSILKRCSVARCARVSGVNFETGKYDVQKDLQLFDRLVARESEDDPKHWSPLEHVATPIAGFEIIKDKVEDVCDFCFNHYQNINRKIPDWNPFIIRLENSSDDDIDPVICWKCAQGHVLSGNFFGFHQFRKEYTDENRDQ